MITQRQLFLKHLAQTSNSPLLLEIEKAEGIYLYDKSGKKYIDLISGIAVSNIGHSHPYVIEAVKNQLDKYMHLMVYGEYVQSPQVLLADMLTNYLPEHLNSVYLVNSGSEANEGAIKLAKRYTGRYEIIAFKNAYHGSTQGTLSIMGNEYYKQPFRPLIPGTKFIEFNNEDHLSEITSKTAAVIVEPIQGEAGITLPVSHFLIKLKERCQDTGSLLILDEIQTGLGRTGTLFAFEQYKISPDIITLAKAFGGGMPLGAFIASKGIMSCLVDNPVLGHITTFGGHPVSCVAAKASLEVLLKENYIDKVYDKENLFRSLLKHPKIKSIRGKGLFLAIDVGNSDIVHKTIDICISKGLVTDWFLFNDTSIRVAPPLIINEKQIKDACNIIIASLNEIE